MFKGLGKRWVVKSFKSKFAQELLRLMEPPNLEACLSEHGPVRRPLARDPSFWKFPNSLLRVLGMSECRHPLSVFRGEELDHANSNVEVQGSYNCVVTSHFYALQVELARL